jgi:hypothetical protein
MLPVFFIVGFLVSIFLIVHYFEMYSWNGVPRRGVAVLKDPTALHGIYIVYVDRAYRNSWESEAIAVAHAKAIVEARKKEVDLKKGKKIVWREA